MSTPRIDAHQHYWRLDRGDYGWLTPELAAIYRDFGPADLAPALERNAVARTILVQAAPTLAETDYLLALAAENPTIAGVVGWCDFAAAAQVEALAHNRLLVGLRPMVQDIADDDWLLNGDLDAAFRALELHNIVFDALVLPRHLSRLIVLADRYPALAIVVDHAAKPHLRERLFEPWRSDMAALAKRPNVVCKFSGLASEMGAAWTLDDLASVADHLLGTFGEARLLWGSDWPVLELAGSYDRWFEAAQTLVGSSDAIFGANARRVYLEKRGRF
jgi:L-fuconolactonase